MPLIKSGGKAAMSKNIKTEMAAGKPQKQAVAIAYSVSRRSKGEPDADDSRGSHPAQSKHQNASPTMRPKNY